MEIKETASIYHSWKNGFSEDELKELSDWLSKFVDGEIKIFSNQEPDGEELLFIKTME